MIDHCSIHTTKAVVQLNPEKKFRSATGLIQSMTSVIPVQCSIHQLSYQANLELVTLRVCNIPVEVEGCK